MELSWNNKIIARGKLQLPDRMKGFERFLNEGKMFLNIAHTMHECNERSTTMFSIMLKALDSYTRLKIQLKEDILEIYADIEDYRYLRDIVLVPMHLDDDEDEWDTEEEWDTEDDDDNFEELEEPNDVLTFDDYDEYSQIIYRKLMLANIELMIARIQNIYASLVKSRLSLYLMLADYCDRAKLFLRRNARFRKLEKPRRGKNLTDGIHCKYILLERLLARIGKEQEKIAKYVDITCNSTTSRTSND